MKNSKKTIFSRKFIIYLLMFPLVFIGCQEDDSQNLQNSETNMLKGSKFQQVTFDRTSLAKIKKEKGVRGWLKYANAALAPSNLQIEKIEFMSLEEAGNTVFFNNVGNKQLSSDYVPNDPRNAFLGTDFLYWIDGLELGTASGMSENATESAIMSAMNTWDAVSCSEGLEIYHIGTTTANDFGDVGLVQFLEGFGGSDIYAPGTILYAGNTSPAFFEAIFGPESNVIGVTFTFRWVNDSDGLPTDIDNNGKSDVAIKEIYINDDPDLNFQDEPNDVLFNGIIDYETIILHEAGHGLSQGHFGKAFTNRSGKIHFSPYALMNAGYSIGNRMITGTDEGGHCSIWEEWPAK